MAYINLEDLQKYPTRINNYDKQSGNKDFVLGIESIIEYAENLPTADVVEVKHGYWKYCHKENVATCSVCGYDHYLGTYHQYAINGCPNCLAKMDGKQHKDATMISEREKLINLMSSAGWNLFTDDQSKEQLADFLIANGVMVMKWTASR